MCVSRVWWWVGVWVCLEGWLCFGLVFLRSLGCLATGVIWYIRAIAWLLWLFLLAVGGLGFVVGLYIVVCRYI